MTVKVMVNGKELELMEQFVTVDDVRCLGDISPDRSITLQTGEGNHLMEAHRRYRVQDGDYFADIPTFKYG